MRSWTRDERLSRIERNDVSNWFSSSMDNVDIIVVNRESGWSKTKTSIRLFDVNDAERDESLYWT